MGLTHLDSGVVIALLDRDDAHHPAAVTTLRNAEDRAESWAISVVGYAECLVGPTRHGPAAVGTLDSLLVRLPIRIVDLGPSIARRAAELRAAHTALRLPDAIILATAALDGADRLLTTDRRWPSSRRLGLGTEIVVL